MGGLPESPDSLASQIRFALAQLRSRNGHHTFEDVCREFSRLRISRNILPATGPVAAGGDQGRDFETFRSFVRDAVDHGFSAVEPAGRLAFTCTLQQDRLGEKIRADVEAVLGGGPIAIVYSFCEADLPVARRHELQQWARFTHQLELEVIDGTGLAELLATPETFWIAVSYLHLPTELSARETESEHDDLPGWYLADRERFRQALPPETFGEFVAVKDCLRRATFDEKARPDLTFWLGRMHHLLRADDSAIVQRARYEIAVATLRGLGELRESERLATMFIEQALTGDDLSLLDDAVVLTTYACGSRLHCTTDLPASVISEWQGQLLTRLETLLGDDPSDMDRVQLLYTLGYLGMQLNAARPEIAQDWPPDTQWRIEDIVTREGELRTDIDLEGLDPLPKEALLDVDRGVAAWNELVALLPEVPLAPIGSLAQVADLLTPILLYHPGWRDILDGLDEETAKRSGRAAVAERARSRATGLRKSGRVVEALREFHQSHVHWFAGDTLRSSILALLQASSCYRELRLPQAGRYYSLAAAWHASTHQDLHDLLPEAVFAAALCDFQSGTWLSFLQTLESGLSAHIRLAEAPVDLARHETLVHALYFLREIRERTSTTLPQAMESVTTLIDNMNLAGILDGLAPPDEEDAATSFADLDSMLTDDPYSDCGPTWRARFSLLGMDWHIECPNKAVTVRAAQRLCAVLQITLVSTTTQDLCLAPGPVHVTVSTATSLDRTQPPRAHGEPLPSNDGRRWRITLTGEDDPPNPVSLDGWLKTEALNLVVSVIIEGSFQDPDLVLEAVKGAFETGLLRQLHVGPAYDILAALVPFPDGDALPQVPVSRPTSISELLSSRTDPGPTYTPEQARTMLINRYRTIPPMLKYTIPRVAADQRTMATIDELRTEGWKDWHLLTGLVNLVLNFRLSLTGEHSTIQVPDLGEEDSEAEPLPLSMITVESLDQGRRYALIPLARHWNLHLHQQTPDIGGLERLLSARYGYWDEDIEHDDPFGAG